MHSGTAVTNLCFSQPHSLHFWHCRSVSLHHVTQICVTWCECVCARTCVCVCVWVWIRFKEKCLRRIQIPWVVCFLMLCCAMHHIKRGCFTHREFLLVVVLFFSFFFCTYFTSLIPSSSSFGHLKYTSETRVMFFCFVFSTISLFLLPQKRSAIFWLPHSYKYIKQKYTRQLDLGQK